MAISKIEIYLAILLISAHFTDDVTKQDKGDDERNN